MVNNRWDEMGKFGGEWGREEFGEFWRDMKRMRLGDVALARLGDKGSNLNIGFFSSSFPLLAWEWLRSFLSS
jgi:hypothetical protein